MKNQILRRLVLTMVFATILVLTVGVVMAHLIVV